MSFALDLSDRLTSHQAFHEIYSSLQRAAAVKTLAQPMTDLEPMLDEDGVFKMLYCAGVFSQTESAKYRHLAQSIALNMLLLDHGEDARSRSLRLLSDLGNFPAVNYAAGHRAADPGGNFLTEFLRTSISKALNTVQVGAEPIALTISRRRRGTVFPMHTRSRSRHRHRRASHSWSLNTCAARSRPHPNFVRST